MKEIGNRNEFTVTEIDKYVFYTNSREVMWKAAYSKRMLTKLAVLRNRNTPVEIIDKLIKDENQAVRASAKSELIKRGY